MKNILLAMVLASAFAVSAAHAAGADSTKYRLGTVTPSPSF